MTGGPDGSELRNTWEMAAPGWAKWEHVFATGFAGASDALLDMASIGPGMRVLDIACGAGSQSIQAAERVGLEGKVLATDISATMLEHVRRNADNAGVRNVETLERAADELDEALAPFDAAICRMALMLFPAPTRALEAVRPLLKPGARFAALVFSTPARCPMLSQAMAILMRHAERPPPPPGTPGMFALGSDGVLDRLMRDCGFIEVKTQTMGVQIALQSADEAFDLMQEAAGAYRAVVAHLDDDARARAWSEVRDCLNQFDSVAGFEAPAEVIIGSGVNPG